MHTPAKAGPAHAVIAAAKVVRGGAGSESHEAAPAGTGDARSLLAMEIVEAGEPVVWIKRVFDVVLVEEKHHLLVHAKSGY